MSVKLRSKKLKNGLQSLWVDVYWAGQRHAQFLDIVLNGNREADKEKLKIAETQRAKIELDILSSKYNWNSVKDVNFLQYAEKILSTKNPSNKRILQHSLDHLKRFSGSQSPFLSTVNSRDYLEHFKVYLLSTGIKCSTAALYFYKLRHIIKIAIDEGLLVKDNSRGIRFPTQERVVRYLTIDEMKILWDAACPNSIVKLAFLFSCFSGLRFSDIFQLEWKDIRDNVIVKRQQKTGQVVHVPLPMAAQHILSQVEKTGDKVFQFPTRSQIDYSLAQWRKNAGLEKFTFHAARHSYAMLLMSANTPIQVISKLLGHSKIQITLGYAKVLDIHKNDAVAKLPNL